MPEKPKEMYGLSSSGNLCQMVWAEMIQVVVKDMQGVASHTNYSVSTSNFDLLGGIELPTY